LTLFSGVTLKLFSSQNGFPWFLEYALGAWGDWYLTGTSNKVVSSGRGLYLEQSNVRFLLVYFQVMF
jgi:hypothetical protein